MTPSPTPIHLGKPLPKDLHIVSCLFGATQTRFPRTLDINPQTHLSVLS